MQITNYKLQKKEKQLPPNTPLHHYTITPSTNIEFLGRIDTQVKIRGFRIETGEIEHHLLKHSSIKEAVVIACPWDLHQHEKENPLVAYFVPKAQDISFAVSQLRTYLADFLPDYMVPSYFVQLQQLPLTPNGKIDKKALRAEVIQEFGKK